MIREHATEGLKTWLKSPTNYPRGLLGRHSGPSCPVPANETDRGANCYSDMKPRARILQAKPLESDTIRGIFETTGGLTDLRGEAEGLIYFWRPRTAVPLSFAQT